MTMDKHLQLPMDLLLRNSQYKHLLEKISNVLAMDIHLQFSTMDKHLQAIMDLHLQAIMDLHLQIGMANAHRSTHFLNKDKPLGYSKYST